MTPDSREARIEAEAVTDAPPNAADALRNSVWYDGDGGQRAAWRDGYRTGWAARKARASNDSGEAMKCSSCGTLRQDLDTDEREAWCYSCAAASTFYLKPSAPQPAPDRVSRIEATLDTLFAGVTGLSEDWDRALIAAAKAWNREGE